MKRLAALVVMSCAAGALAQPTDPYLPFKMISDSNQPFSYYVDSRPASLDVTMVRNAVERAWDSWNAVNCASPKVRSLGAAGGVVPNVISINDAYSVSGIFMQTLDVDAREVFGNVNFVVAVSIPRAYAGVLQTCDTFFNGFSGRWSLDAVTPANTMDVETVMLHEAGHCLGLNHFGVDTVMEQVVEPGLAVRALTIEDVDTFCQRNPNFGAEGARCYADGGCQTTNLKCLAQPTTQGVTTSLCTKGCSVNTNANCEIPLSCQSSNAFQTSGLNGACLLPGTAITQVGKACTMQPECGNTFALCRRPEPASNNNFFWVDGYCTQRCETGDPVCPAGATCVQLDNGHYCTQSCRVGLADCRPDYTCAPIDAIGTSGVCIPRCYGDQDCADPTNTTCRTCDGLCVGRQNVSGQIGDVCNSDSSCGAGQTCRVTDSRSTTKQCTAQCARGCAMCPTGTTCTPGARGELFCLKDCTGPGTCPIGLRCADTTVGKACQPQCTSDTDCPVGQGCYLGECYTPNEDAGCGSILCMKPDAGRPAPVVPKDGGVNLGGTGGCGCTSIEPLALIALASLVIRRRRSRA